MLCHISVVANLAFGSRCFECCVTFRRVKLQVAVNYANLFNYAVNAINNPEVKFGILKILLLTNFLITTVTWIFNISFIHVLQF